jgi:ribonuclease HI
MRTLANLAKKLQLSYIKALMSPEFHVYTDGSHKEGHGAWAFLVVKRGKVVAEKSGYCKHTSSDRMELQAAIEALQWLPKSVRSLIHTDSRTMIENINKRIPDLDRLGWKTKRTVSNLDLLRQLNFTKENRNVSWHWVKAHSGKVHNERCDELCREARVKKTGFYETVLSDKNSLV